MDSNKGQVRYLYESIDGLKDQKNPRRKVLLTLLYWKIFDGIDIPAEVMKEILTKGTNPETIYRNLRHVNSEVLKKKLEDKGSS